ncbi:SRPBCC family protein [Frankia gtarii]|uniref:SRPBCC family protein n=1 Tax=Frankia gtarii TaxID=2950102 RepID=UPI0021C22D80|nr:SRPBCC family protein [Frankia gtarii]
MTSTVNVLDATSWDLGASIAIDAPAAKVYELVSDITRTGEWSPECVGGSWVSGAVGQVGARFYGYNQDGPAAWTSESEVIRADEARAFAFSVLRFRVGGPGDGGDWMDGLRLGDISWEFELAEDGNGCVLIQRHTMKVISPFYRAMLEQAPESERAGQLRSREEHLRGAMRTALDRIKAKAEGQA